MSFFMQIFVSFFFVMFHIELCSVHENEVLPFLLLFFPGALCSHASATLPPILKPTRFPPLLLPAEEEEEEPEDVTTATEQETTAAATTASARGYSDYVSGSVRDGTEDRDSVCGREAEEEETLRGGAGLLRPSADEREVAHVLAHLQEYIARDTHLKYVLYSGVSLVMLALSCCLFRRCCCPLRRRRQQQQQQQQQQQADDAEMAAVQVPLVSSTDEHQPSPSPSLPDHSNWPPASQPSDEAMFDFSAASKLPTAGQPRYTSPSAFTSATTTTTSVSNPAYSTISDALAHVRASSSSSSPGGAAYMRSGEASGLARGGESAGSSSSDDGMQGKVKTK